MDGLLTYAREVAAPEPGDAALFKFGRCFAHGAVIVEWPWLIHAWNSLGVVRADASKPALVGRPVRFFSPFGPAKINPPIRPISAIGQNGWQD
jgi:hypothetical protein